MADKFTFVGQQTLHDKSRLVRSKTACEACRSKKSSSSVELPDLRSAAARSHNRARDLREDVHQPETRDRSESTPAVPSNPVTPRFVGDLNPEARPLETPAALEKDTAGPRDGSVASQLPVPLAPVSDLIPMERISALSDLHFSHIHPIIPILNEQEYRESLSGSRTLAVLAHVVCLLAAKDNDAGQHLYLLRSSEVTVTSRQFCSHVYASITTALRSWNNLKKITLFRVQPCGPGRQPFNRL
ncbi:hypothetical protein F4678DRAFT_486952 [Xylaria arbuscula]|nr:hypothetical protein F4678DRAFT_486952 [Xylaria arbuscula]